MTLDDPASAQWRALLTGEDPSLLKVRSLWKRVPSAPRCKVCASPFHGVGGAAARLMWHGPVQDNPLLCKACFGHLANFPGGAELEISIVFADVRGSTGLAERISAARYRGLLQEYYRVAATAVDHNGGIVDKFLGDGVMALFIPVIAGENHAARAIRAATAILEGVDRSGLSEQGFRVGAGVHTGEAFVGAIGSEGKIDFTALGDSVNVAARLGSVAGPGELLVSRDSWSRADGTADVAARQVEIAGRSGGLEVVAIPIGRGTAASPS
ncbi:MAG: adenylate/guanylate cyclase domain-containing protein [Chloroflexi bacterium]|nr:adenylate/guanylate cyclase domain-containing protein [Chloroflexota bacterium]